MPAKEKLDQEASKKKKKEARGEAMAEAGERK